MCNVFVTTTKWTIHILLGQEIYTYIFLAVKRKTCRFLYATGGKGWPKRSRLSKSELYSSLALYRKVYSRPPLTGRHDRVVFFDSACAPPTSAATTRPEMSIPKSPAIVDLLWTSFNDLYNIIINVFFFRFTYFECIIRVTLSYYNNIPNIVYDWVRCVFITQ